MAEDKKKQAMPPYVPYSTFINFINKLKDSGIPSHIDRSIMGDKSGSGQSAMLATLRSLSLINSKSEPTNQLQKLVSATKDEFSTLMNTIVKSTYSFLFNESIDLATTTTKKVEDKFREIGASGSTLTKCIAFFLAASKTANISISQYVKAPKLASTSTNQGKRKVKSKTNNENSGEADLNEKNENLAPKGMDTITIPLKDLQDGQIRLPANMDETQIKSAVKMVKFILDNYYGLGGINHEKKLRLIWRPLPKQIRRINFEQYSLLI